MKAENKDQLVDILTYHVLASQVFSKDLKSFQRVKTVEGQALHVYKSRRGTVQVTSKWQGLEDRHKSGRCCDQWCCPHH